MKPGWAFISSELSCLSFSHPNVEQPQAHQDDRRDLKPEVGGPHCFDRTSSQSAQKVTQKFENSH